MAKSIGTLFVEYRATADKYLADLKQMAKDSKEFERTLKPLVDHAKNLGIGFSIAGAAINTALIGAAKVAANFGDALDETAEKTGVTVENLGRLKYAAEQNDSSFEGLSTGLKFLSKNLFEAATGGKEQSKIFAALGIATKSATGAIRPANDVLTDLSGIFSKLPNGAEKTALALKIFGKAGQDLIPFLNQGPEGLKKLGDEAERMGVVVDAASAKLGDEFNKALDRSKTAALGLSLSIGNVLLPSLTSIIDKGNEVVIFASGIARQFPFATQAALGLGAALTAVGGGLLGIAALGTIAPKVAQGLALIQSTLAPASILLAVRNFRDLAAAIELIGAASLTAKLGLIGLAAALGVGIGAAINMAVEAAGLTSQMDQLILSMSRSLGFNRNLGQSLGSTADAIKKTTDELAKRGIVVERGTMTEQQYIEALAKTLRAHLGLKDKVVETGSATSDYEKILKELIASLNKTSKEVDHTADRLAELSNFLRGAETNLQAPISRFANNSIALLDALGNTFSNVQAKFGQGIMLGPLITDAEMLDIVFRNNEAYRQKQASDEADMSAARRRDDVVRLAAIEKQKQALEAATASIKNSAGHIFDDMFVKGQNVFKSLANLLKGGALSLGRSIFEDIAGALLGPIKLAFDNFFKGLISGPLESLGKALSKSLTASVTGSAATKAVGGVVGSVGSVGGGVAGAAGSAASSLTSGLISGGIAALGSIVGALITKGNAKRTEENTRESRDWLELQTNAWNPLFNQMVYYQKGIYELFSGTGSTISGAGRVGPSHLAGVQQGVSVSTINADFNFNPTLTFNVSGGDRSELTIRDEMDQIITALETGIRGYRERLMQIVRDSINAPESTPVPVNS